MFRRASKERWKKNATPRRPDAWLPNKPRYEPLRAPRYAHVQGEPTIARQPEGFAQECTFPLCISGSVRTLYPAEKDNSMRRKNNDRQGKFANIFPAECGAALAAINVSHGMVPSCHLTVIRFPFNNVNPAHATRQHAPLGGNPIQAYTSSNK